MSEPINLNTMIQPLVYGTNWCIDWVSKQYVRQINPKGSSMTCAYNIKVTVFNAATAFLVFKIAQTVLGKGSARSLLIDTVLMLFVRSIMTQTLSLKGNVVAAAKGLVNKVTGEETIEEAAAWSNAKAAASSAWSRFTSAPSGDWSEDVKILGFTILKSWKM